MENHTHEITEVPTAARVVTMALSMITISVLAICLTRRIQFTKNWKTITMTNALIIAIYVDSFLFIFCTAILSKAFSLNQSAGICDGAILLCLISYMTTKILIYYFLVEKVYIIRTVNTSRMKSKLWLFNFFGVICPYVILVVLNFVFRIAYINDKGVCVIGMKRKALVPLITFDIILNVYLTSLFLHPLRQCYSFKQGASSRMRTLVLRTFVGSCATLLMSVVNLSVLTILDGEPGYICLCLCNLDILFTVCVLHWATAIDRQEQTSNSGSRKPKNTSESRGGLNSTTGGKQGDYVELDERVVAQLTTKIEANKGNQGSDMLNSRAIEVKTQHLREVEIEPYDIDSESGNWRESQERIVKPGSI
ncbi:hypothetical protein AUEXF2481DRAFT_620082 [Aureobasidium subglaciale EXF-2481]|uniref:G-protein coupled receptors family 1 profile domain-containing protein n=1 Tax=Aureobasidium subglaciale (strain EXF-2481) TaxID=1043005 RepID=A0A074YS25_AURSE|nr:uncharacterized protein AUEXF2481DRAFT_620082 [Aureobasidium subglaciale EXF-2481]KEQ96917.1 hypothetical protein AUEXF2481DRAFT_620082 [Aureobasidium subglaciale EXF-2481]